MEKNKIFISHRHSDTQSDCRALKSDLQKHFGKENVFLDIENLEPGIKFAEAIEKTLAQSKVVLVAIGPDWFGAKDENGVSRLFQPKDWVRREVAASLGSNDTRVIPILLKGVTIPEVDQLPDDLKSLTELQAAEIDNKRWDYDVNELVKVLEKIIPKKRDPTPQPEPHPKPTPFPPPPAQPKSWWAKNYLWMIGGLVGFLILVGMCVPDEEYITPVDQDSATRDQLVQDAEALVETSPNQDPGVTNPEGNEIYESLTLDSEGGTDTNQSVHDMAGEWSLYLNGQKVSIFAFNQEGPNVAYYEYDLLNQRTAEGKGQIDGEYLAMDYYSTATDVAGTISLSTDNQGQTWIGTIYFPSNGVTAEVKLTR